MSGGVSLTEADAVAPVTAALASLDIAAPKPMTNTKTETNGTELPADPTPLPPDTVDPSDVAPTSVVESAPPAGAPASPHSGRAPATSAVVTTAGILPVSHAAIAAAAAAMSSMTSSSSNDGSAPNGDAAAVANASTEEGGDSAKTNESGQQGPKKMPMALVNELAKYNKVKTMYVLEDEAGPAHDKTFYIRLEVGDERFHAHGPSIRKAQHAAAEVCLQVSGLWSFL